jgi:membrane-associated phospholipid phosphatase
MVPNLRSPWIWLPPALSLLLLAAIVATGANQALFLLLNRTGHLAGDNFWLNLTMLGDGAVALALVLPAIRRSPRCFWAALLAGVIAALWVQVLKQVVSVPRPLAVLAPGLFFQSGPGYRAVSFPSGHAAAIFAVAGIWVMALQGRAVLRAMLLALAVLVSLSRVMVGVHWPLDILWGMLGGWLGAWAGLVLYARFRWRTAGVGGIVAGLLLLLVAASLLLSKHIGIPAALPLQRALGLVCLVLGAREMFLMLPRMSLRRRSKGE